VCLWGGKLFCGVFLGYLLEWYVRFIVILSKLSFDYFCGVFSGMIS
jgi:hypothetical protein